MAEPKDETYGGNLRAMRERKGMSQGDLARAMTDRGRPWHQQTVAETESGERPLRLKETEELAGILGSTVMAFTYEPAEIGEAQIVYDAGTYVVRAWATVAEAVFMLMIHRGRAGSTMRQHRKSGYERVQAAIEDTRARMREHPLEEAVWEGIARYEHRGERAGEEG